MKNQSWVIADTHFGHAGVCRFMAPNGIDKLRPWDDTQEMDEAMIQNWNSVVGPSDRVYHLGDVAINRKALHVLSRLNGRMVLVKGNHDIFALKDYLPYFDDIRAYVVKKTEEGGKLILSHIPIHEESLGRWGLNIHGHLHAHKVMQAKNRFKEDKRYVCVSVEQTSYFPLTLQEAVSRGVPERTDWYTKD
jgi:calcineurin-like phosphoesterase family protein